MIPLLLLLACGGGETGPAAVDLAPESPGLAECAVCGMVVREQPGPRGQVLHRDGAREFACSLGDLRALLAVPSPHGKVEHIWVEVLPASLGLDEIGTAERSWVPAEDASYVGGIARPLVMGVPALSYATEAEAAAAASRLGGYPTTWALMRDTRFDLPPPAAP